MRPPRTAASLVRSFESFYIMKYELYHDESKEAGYWHGMLLVPISIKDELISKLVEVRENLNHHHEIGLKSVKKEQGTVYAVADSWLQVAFAALRGRTKNESYPVYLGDRIKGKKQYSTLESPIGCKLIIFREIDNHSGYDSYPDYGSKVETSFRIGLKGGLHFLGREQSPIEVVKCHFDGHQHYNRKLNPKRIVGRLSGLKSYCDVTDKIDDRTCNHNEDDSQSYEDCQILQLTDLLVGSFRTCLHHTKIPHLKLATHAKNLITEYQKGYRRMQNSKWAGSLCISQCSCREDGWKFESIEYFKKESGQQELNL